MFAVLLIGFLAVSLAPISCDMSTQTPKEWSELICINCKCDNVKGRKSGEEVASRDACEDLAYAAGAKYYNFMVDGPFVKICAYSAYDVPAAESMSSEESCGNGNREFGGGEPTRVDGKRDEQRDREAGITKSDWKIFEIKDECRDNTCAVSLATITIDPADKGYKCTGLDHIGKLANPNTEETLLECGQKAHDAGFDYFSYRTDKKYCYYGDQHSSPYHCEDEKRVKTKSQDWGIYSVTCA